MPKITRSIQYRYLNRISIGDRDDTLEELLRAGLKVKNNNDVIGEKARARIADLDQSGQLTVLNGIQGLAKPGFVAGELFLYRKGFDVPAIAENLDSDDNRFETTLFRSDGKNKPIVGALYFAAIGDHVGLIGSQAVTSRWLERYLTWLLKEKADAIGYEDVVELNAAISIDGEPPSRNGPARGMAIRAAAVSGDGAPKVVRTERAKGRGGTVLEVLKVLGIGQDAIESIQRDIPEGGALEGDFQVWIKEGRNRKPLSTDTLDHAFRNVEPDDLNISRPGSRAKGKALYLSETARISEAAAGLDPNEAIEVILEQLYKWGKNGVINLGRDT